MSRYTRKTSAEETGLLLHFGPVEEQSLWRHIQMGHEIPEVSIYLGDCVYPQSTLVTLIQMVLL